MDGTSESRAKEIVDYIQELKIEQILVRWDVIIESINNQEYPKYKHDEEFIKLFVKHAGLDPQTDPNKRMICVRFELDRVKMVIKSLKTKILAQKLKEVLP